MLPALTARTVSVNPNVIRLNVDFNAVVNLGRNVHAGKRRMPPLRLIKGRNSHQPVHANLARQISERILANHRKCRGLDSSFFAGLVVVHLRLESLPLRPSQIHSQQHLGPVLRLGSPSPRMNRHDRIQAVVLSRKQRLGFHPVDEFAQRVHVALQIRRNILAFAGQIEIGGDVVSSARQVPFKRQQAFQPLALAHYLLRFCRIRPQIGIRRLLFDFRKLLAQLTRVKDTPAGRGPWSLKKSIAVPVHPTFLSLDLSSSTANTIRIRVCLQAYRKRRVIDAPLGAASPRRGFTRGVIARAPQIQNASPPRLLKLSHTDMRTNRHVACKSWYSHSARKAPPARYESCAELPPRSVHKDRSKPSFPY